MQKTRRLFRFLNEMPVVRGVLSLLWWCVLLVWGLYIYCAWFPTPVLSQPSYSFAQLRADCGLVRPEFAAPQRCGALARATAHYPLMRTSQPEDYALSAKLRIPVYLQAQW